MQSISRSSFAEGRTMRMPLFRLVASVGALMLPLALGSMPAIAAPKVHTVIIDKMRFGPVPADVRAGDVILWVNRDLFRHTATARDGSFNIDLAAGANGRTVARRAGVFAFFCKYHPGMTGRLAVRG